MLIMQTNTPKKLDKSVLESLLYKSRFSLEHRYRLGATSEDRIHLALISFLTRNMKTFAQG